MTYQDLLKDEFKARRLRNSQYSQAAFARDLAISPSLLSEILSGTHGLSPNRALDVAQKLGLNHDEAEVFADSAASQHARGQKQKRAATARLKNSRDRPKLLGNSQFNIVGDWLNLAILEKLMLHKDISKSDLAKAFDVSLKVVDQVLEKLLRAKLIQKKRNSFRRIIKRTIFETTTNSLSIRNFHLGLLEKAKESITRLDRSERYVSSAIIAIPADRMPDFADELDRLRRKFCDDARCQSKGQRVFGFSIQLFPLDKEVSYEN